MVAKKLAIVFIFLMVSMTLAGPTASVSKQDKIAKAPSSNTTSSMATARILIDESHCATDTELWTPANASRFGSLLMSYGHTVITNFDASLDSGILDTFDIFMLFFPQVELTAGEVSAIEDFVDNGGHLLLVGIDNRPTVGNYSSQPLNAISETYGITFNEDAYLGRAERSAGDLIDHHITYSVDSVLGRGGNFLQSCSLTLTSPAVSLCTIKDFDFAAYAEVGDSKIVASGGAAPFLVFGHDSWLISEDDSEQLCLNIVDWMLGNEERVVEVPDEYDITVGNGPDLNATEIEDYQMFTGLIHDHTTYSDGRSTAEEMTLAAINAQLDFMVMTDHSWEHPSEVGIHGALKCEEYVQDYQLDTLIVVGAELSNGPHTLGFPLTENIWSGDLHEKVDGIHAQGGIALLCHPLLGTGYIEPWTNYDEYGFDGFEVLNDVYSYGEGEAAYYRPFYAASDTHDANRVGSTLNAIFVKNPSGPNGTLSQDDIVDALLNRRIIAICNTIDTMFGESVWLNRYLELRDQAETAIEDAQDTVTQAITDGATATLASMYLDAAIKAVQYNNPIAAIEKAEMASSEYLLGIDIDVDGGFGLIDPNGQGTLTVTLVNDLTEDVSMKIIPTFPSSIVLDQSVVDLEATAESTGSAIITGDADEYGYTSMYLNIMSYSSVDPIDPILLPVGGFIANISSFIESVDGGQNATIQIFYDRGDTRYISSITVEYDDGTGQTTITMSNLGDRYSISLGPYTTETNITYTVTVNDVYGNQYVFDEHVLAIPATGVQIDTVTVLIIAGAGVGIIALVIVLLKLKK